MNWTILGYIADIIGILSFIVSLGILRKVHAKVATQKETYEKERDDLLANLQALRENIWQDNLSSLEFQDALQTKVFEYQMKYLFISSLRCIFHAFRCTHLLKKGINDNNTKKLRNDINFLIARLSKKE